MNKPKILMSVMILLLLVGSVSASALFAIGMQGLGQASPEIAGVISNVICVSNPVGCVSGKLVGAVQSEAMAALAEQNPELVAAFNTYNQVQTYTEAGAEITQDLEVDETGQVIGGVIEFKDKEGRFGNLIGKDIEQDEIFGKEIALTKDGERSLVTFSGENSYINVKGDLFKGVEAQSRDTNALIIMDKNGDVQEADLTASEDTSFVLGEKRVEVMKGTRVIYMDGKITIEGGFGDEIRVMDKITDENGAYTFANVNTITLLAGNKELIIAGNSIRGEHFQIGDLEVRPQVAGGIGEVKLVPEGYLLQKRSMGKWNGMEIITGQELLLANSPEGVESYDNWILPGETKLKARGEGFSIEFQEGNKWANIEDKDYFTINAIDNFAMELENRDIVSGDSIIGLIPKMSISGDFAMEQNSKEIFSEGGKLMISRGGVGHTSTSPLELVISDMEGNPKQEKYIISNFKGIATVPLDASEGISDERYANSIYQVRAKTDNRYNYPTIADFEKISGKKLEFVGDELIQPEYIRALMDIYESNPESSFEGTNSIKILGSEEFLAKGYAENWVGVYKSKENTFYIKGGDDVFGEEYTTIIHEAGHGIHLGKIFTENKFPLIDSEWEELLETDYKDIDFVERGRSLTGQGLVNDWDVMNEEFFEALSSYDKDALSKSPYIPYKGFVRSYGATNIKEDIATYREMIIGDPGYFKRLKLLDDSEGNIMYDSAYKQKVDLLLEYGFITDNEYDAVFNPEKYGL